MIWYFKDYFINGNETLFYIFLISIILMIIITMYFGVKENKK